ncbi:MAG: RodZ family helix-turn-helix domain-containing protein [Halopseudomonas sp.]
MSKSKQADDVTEAVGRPDPGSLLRQAREDQGVSLDEVSDRIKISTVQLDALESGDVERLPGLAYSRGYVRTYARLLGLDADALVQDFNALYGEGGQRQVQTINRVKPQAHLGDPMLRISIIVFVLILIGSSVWWWQTQMVGDTPILSPPSVVEPVSSESAAVQPQEVVDTELQAESVGLSQDGPAPIDEEAEPEYLSDAEIARLAQELDSAAEKEVTDIVVSAPAVVADSGSQVVSSNAPLLLVRFNSECWVSIKDNSGKVVFASLMQDGDTLERNLDSLPVQLLVGQTSAVVEAAFRGKPLALAQYSKKGVARLTLE